MKYSPLPTKPLGSVTKFLSGGTPRKDNGRFWGGRIPWISSAEMTQERIYTTTHYVTEEGAKNGTRLIPANTVLAVVRGMSLAKECRISITTQESTFNQDLKALAPLPEVNSVFLFYYLRSQRLALRDSASEAAHGTKKLDIAVLEQWPFPLLPLPLQEKIAAILTAYDDLIETNKRRIVLLEKMAEELYREWFVRMRFPGYQNTKFSKGVPEGWGIRELKDCAKVNPATIGRNEYIEYIQYVDISSVTTNHIENIQKLRLAEAPGRARRRVRHGDVFGTGMLFGPQFVLQTEPIA